MWSRAKPVEVLYAVVDEDGGQYYRPYEHLKDARSTRTRLQNDENRYAGYGKREPRKYKILMTYATWEFFE